MKNWIWRFAAVSLVSFIALILVIELHEERPSSPNTSHVKNPRQFYIYDWASDVIDATPKTFTHHRLSITGDFLLNHGAGKVLNEKKGLYQTHQYTLFLLMYHRLLSSPLRTLNPEEASLFFIPYDLGMDSSTRTSDGALFKTNCPRLDRVMDLLVSSPYFQRKQGKDHFLVHSINHMMTYYANQQCTRLYQMCFNCTKLSIDVYSSDMYPTLASEPHMTHNWISVPFPSDYHYSSASVQAPWKVFIDPMSKTVQYTTERPYLLSFVGSVQVTAKKQKELREMLIAECAAVNQVDPFNCLLNSLETHDSMTSHYLPPGTNGTSHESAAFKNPYAVSRLCLMPGGDFPTRKGFLDAMLSGCVPVTFQLAAAQDQWPLHWISREKAMKCTFFLDRGTVIKDVGAAVRRLMLFSQDLTLLSEKLKCIGEIAHRFQYSLGDSLAKDDAVDVILNFMLK